MILAVGVVAGLFAAWLNDQSIEEINRKQTAFILSQCEREKYRTDIAIKFLERDEARVKAESLDPAVKAAYLSIIKEQKNHLQNIPKCVLP